jgi:hypothetical protein
MQRLASFLVLWGTSPGFLSIRMPVDDFNSYGKRVGGCCARIFDLQNRQEVVKCGNTSRIRRRALVLISEPRVGQTQQLHVCKSKSVAAHVYFLHPLGPLFGHDLRCAASIGVSLANAPCKVACFWRRKHWSSFSQ